MTRAVLGRKLLRSFAGLLGLLGAAGCAAPTTPLVPEIFGPVIVLHPPPARKATPTAAAHAAAPDGDSPAQVIRDNEALRDEATRYVVGPDSTATQINDLTTLTFRATEALRRLRRGTNSDGRLAPVQKSFRVEDVTAARVAADAIASYLATQARTDAPRLARVPTAPAEAPHPEPVASPAPGAGKPPGFPETAPAPPE